MQSRTVPATPSQDSLPMPNRTELGPDRARQGGRGRHVALILGASLLLLAGGWFAAETYGESIDAQPTQMQTSQ